jgi:hypothetical protein
MLTFKQYIQEMPQALGSISANLADDNFNSQMYGYYSKQKHIGDIGDVSVHHNKDGKETRFSVLDHKNKRVGFSTTVERRSKNKNIPFSHHTQTYVNKDPKTNLGKGFGSNFVYDHLIHNQKVPLVSDERQYAGGHKMWHHLINKSFEHGHHAYLVDNGKLTKITPENKDEIMSSSYGPEPSFKSKRYAISKTPLE